MRVFFDRDVKVETLAWLFAPFLCLAFVSPLLVLCVPLLLERMLSSNPYHWGTSAHYSLTIAPIIVMAAADGLARVGRLVPAARRRTVLATACAGGILLINTGIAAQGELSALADPDFYRRSDSDLAVRRALAAIPPSASVAAQSRFVPHLSQRDEVIQLSPYAPRTDYVVADAGDYFQSFFPNAGHVDAGFLARERSARYTPVFVEGDLTVLRRRTLGDEAAVVDSE